MADVGGESAGSEAPEPRPEHHADAPIDIDGFHVTDAMRRWVVQTFGPVIDVDFSTTQFVSHYRSTGTRRQNWPEAWRKWIRDDVKRAAQRAQHTQGTFLVPLEGGAQTPPPTTRRSTTDERVAGWLALASGEESP
ncbi:hypothetical protein ACFYOF_16725 [Streptomyces sp. NPDC007148]|uniref:hypothetical protein n=1 Tax=Streptomyces sp. NPDC007148 TaxID=3364775 RepID=UPI0036C97BEE